MKISEVIEICFNTPWKLFNEIKRIILLPIAWLLFRMNGIRWGKGWKIYGLPILQIYRGSKVTIGDYLELRSNPSSNPLSPFHPVVISTRSAESVLKIGDHFSMTGGSLVAEEKIIIGDGVMVGANSLIMDTDFHQLIKSKKLTKPICIEDEVFLGTQTLVLKGTTIGKKSVVGAGSTVSGSFSGKSLIIGNSAKMLKRLSS